MKPKRGKIPPAIGSTAKEKSVARRRYQRGSVFKNRAKTVWFGTYAEYVLDSNGVEQRNRKQIVLGPIRKPDGSEMTKREAIRILQPYVDRANSSLSASAKAKKSATFEAFSKIGVRDYLSSKKPSTQATMRGQVKRLKAAFGEKDIRQIDAGDLQRIVAAMHLEEYNPKTIRNLWVTVRLIWDAALAQEYVDRILPKPNLPRTLKKEPRYLRLTDVGKILSGSSHAKWPRDERVFYWLAAEAGLRAGELAGLRLIDVYPNYIAVNQAVWNGKVSTPKTQNAVRKVAISEQLAVLLAIQKEHQASQGHDFLFSTSTGSPWDMNMFRKRKMKPLLSLLGILQAGLHAFRHFNASLLTSLRVPLKTIQERLGHASGGSLTLDVYTHAEMNENHEAAQRAGDALQEAENSVS